MVIPEFWLYAGFLILVTILLALDLGVFNKTPHVVKLSEALGWVTFWVTLAVAFCGFVYYTRGSDAAFEFFTGYLLEQSLSVDNIFVIILILRYFKVAPQYHHKVLFWGIIGAVLMRGTMIAVGAALIHTFDWIFYVFGAFLVFTGIRMAFSNEDAQDLESNAVVKLSRRFLKLTKGYHQDHFWIRRMGVTVFTPLFVVLLTVEFTDLIFAVDSIPAIFAITDDTFIVFTSNIFAVMGLRSLFFAVSPASWASSTTSSTASPVILSFIGVKMIIKDIYHIDTLVALGVIASILAISIIMSMIFPEKKPAEDSKG